MGAESAVGDVTPPGDPAAVSITDEQQSEPEDKPRPPGFLRRRFVVVDPEIPLEVLKVLEDVAWDSNPVKELATNMRARSTGEMKLLRVIVIMVPLMAVILGFTLAQFLTTEVSLSDIRETWIALVWMALTTLIVIAGTWEYTFNHHIVKARLLGHLLRALSACVELEKRPLNIRIRGRVAQNIHAASKRFDFVYSRLPGHRARTYSTELKNRAASGAQAIASMTALLFAGTEAIPDLRDRLARAILRVEAEDWTAVAELGTGGGVFKRSRSFRRLVEPATIPLLVGGLTLITTALALVGKMVE